MPDKVFKRDQVVEIIGSLLSRVSSNHAFDYKLFEEVKHLKDTMDTMREDLHLAHPDYIQSHIPRTADELDAIVATTEEATNTIIHACEIIQQRIEESQSDIKGPIENEITRIIEACTFQDLTGQRVTKIAKALIEIERQANRLSKILNERFIISVNPSSQEQKGDPLLNGPALPAQGITQEEIDKLLNDF